METGTVIEHTANGVVIPLEYAALASCCVVLRSQPYYLARGSHTLIASISLKIKDVTHQRILSQDHPLTHSVRASFSPACGFLQRCLDTFRISAKFCGTLLLCDIP